MNIEEVCKDYEYAISAAGVIGIWASIVVSLWLARSGRKTRLKARADIMEQPTPSLAVAAAATSNNKKQQYVLVNIRNVGAVITRISRPPVFVVPLYNFFRKLKLCSILHLVVCTQKHPLILYPKSSETLDLGKVDKFLNSYQTIFKKQSGYKKILYKFLSLRILADDGSEFVVKIGKNLKKKMRQLTKE